MKNLSSSIVVYKNKVEILKKAIRIFLWRTLDSKRFVVDSSPIYQPITLVEDPRIICRFSNKIVGFVARHQRAEIGEVMPKVLYPDGRLQPLSKLLPTPQTLMKRRFFYFSPERENYRYGRRFSAYSKIMDVPFLSGCFLFLRTEALTKAGLFDERFFPYTEDADLSRRIQKYYRTVYFPPATIYHQHQRGSYRNIGSRGAIIKVPSVTLRNGDGSTIVSANFLINAPSSN